MNIDQQFEQECKDWLQPLGYSIHSTARTSNTTTVIMSNSSNVMNPSIICTMRFDDLGTSNKTCDLLYSNLKFLINLSCKGLSFKHSLIEDFINQITKYAIVCSQAYPMRN